MLYLINLATNSYNIYLYMWAVILIYDLSIFSSILLESELQSAESQSTANSQPTFLLSCPLSHSIHYKSNMILYITHLYEFIILALKNWKFYSLKHGSGDQIDRSFDYTGTQEVVKSYVDARNPDLGNLLTRFSMADFWKARSRRYQCRMVRYGCAEERAVFHGQTRMSKFFTIMPLQRKPYQH
jgi:hypothetical protein